MAKEKMTMDEAYMCPRCGSQYVSVGEMEQIFDDARSEDVTCLKCQSTWRVFYRMLDFNKKTLNITDIPLEDTHDVEVNADGVLEDVDPVVTEVSHEAEDVITTDCHVVNEDGKKPGIVEET
jgi:hypothetical protein